MSRLRQVFKWLAVVAAAVILAYFGATAWRGVRLLEERTPIINEIRAAEQSNQIILRELRHSEERNQCYFTLIAERSLVTDPEVAAQMARDYLSGVRCPAVGPTSPP